MVDNNQSDSSTENNLQKTSVNDLGDGTSTEQQDIAERGKSSRGAESRIHELVDEVKATRAEVEAARAEAKAAQEKALALEQRLNPPTNTSSNPNAQKAVEYLKSLGFTQKTDVESELQAIRDRMALDTEHSRLKNDYDGSDGRPVYKQADVEKFMREQGIYNPEVAYKTMHEAELLDWSIKKASSDTRQKPHIEKPGSTQASREDNTITREKIGEWMKTPEGRIKYEENREKILQLMTEGKL